MGRSCRAIAVWITIAALGAASGCVNVNSVLERRFEARQLVADLLVQFSRSADASNRAVMADTDDRSVAFAREAGQGTEALQKKIDTLGPILQELGYSDESRLLDAFVSRFAAYRELDRRILDLAVEHSNLKAEQLSFGPGQEAADAFQDAVESIVPSVGANETWRVQALVARAVATVREIQVLQAPHIADADEAVMTRMEKRMATSETGARKALETLTRLAPPASRPRLAAASAALDRFMDLNSQIIALSRRNTNVRSLALSLDQKRTLTVACEESLRALHDTLARRGSLATR